MAAGPFDVVDPKLTIYALANGMDLVKEDDATRLLTWYRDGRERGIEITPDPDGAGLTLTAVAWATNKPETRQAAVVRSGVDQDALAAKLSDSLEDVMEAANGL